MCKSPPFHQFLILACTVRNRRSFVWNDTTFHRWWWWCCWSFTGLKSFNREAEASIRRRCISHIQPQTANIEITFWTLRNHCKYTFGTHLDYLFFFTFNNNHFCFVFQCIFAHFRNISFRFVIAAARGGSSMSTIIIYDWFFVHLHWFSPINRNINIIWNQQYYMNHLVVFLLSCIFFAFFFLTNVIGCLCKCNSLWKWEVKRNVRHGLLLVGCNSSSSGSTKTRERVQHASEMLWTCVRFLYVWIDFTSFWRLFTRSHLKNFVCIWFSTFFVYSHFFSFSLSLFSLHCIW